MSLDFITQLYIPIVMVICLAVGYVLKNFIPTDNKWIPLCMLVLGAILACICDGISLHAIGAGMVTGLASTGFHQAFVKLLNLNKASDDEEDELDDEDDLDEDFEDDDFEDEDDDGNYLDEGR